MGAKPKPVWPVGRVGPLGIVPGTWGVWGWGNSNLCSFLTGIFLRPLNFFSLCLFAVQSIENNALV